MSRHRSSEAEVNRFPCLVSVDVAGIPIDSVEVTTGNNPFMPEWVPVEGNEPVILEGTVTESDEGYPGPHVSFEDIPISHYTHDFTFFVRPDLTSDNRFTDLLGVQVRGTQETTQELIEIEWETGLAASNDGNPLTGANVQGDSGGFFSIGHRRREIIWNWPTLDDWVHVEGLWIWDRGHQPGETEIHPPRFIAIRRNLLAYIRKDPIQSDPRLLATRIDIFGNGDGGALSNNRPGVPSFVQHVPMSGRDYSFIIRHAIPRPSPSAQLRSRIEKRPGDTFPGELIIEELPAGDGQLATVRVTVPWRTLGAPDIAVFARTLFLYWDEGLGGPPDFIPRAFRVTFERVHVVNTQDTFDGEFRLFVDAGGSWMFENEFHGDPGQDILNDGLGDTGDDQDWTMNRQFVVIVPPGGRFRIHAGGWEADGVNDVFGKLFDPNHRCDDELKNFLRDNLFTLGVFFNGSRDDPIGEINHIFDQSNGFGLGPPHADSSSGKIAKDVWSQQDTDPNDSYRIHYHIEEVFFPFLQ